MRLRSLGDCVLTTPALQVLRQARPDLHIGVVVEERFADIFAGSADADDILPPRAGAVARWRARLCLNLHGGTRSLLLTLLSGARYRAGFAHYRYSRLYNIRIPTAQRILGVSRKVHTAEHLASAVFFLGAPPMDIPRARLAGTPPARKPYAVIHPFASAPDKTWPAERFARAAGHLRGAMGLEPLILGAQADDFTPFAGFPALRGAPLGEVKNLLAGASLFLGNDSGPAHMAAAFGRPVVVLFGNSDRQVWAPWKTESEVLWEAGGIHRIPVERVLEALERARTRP